MTSSTWSFETQDDLIGCGVDVEGVDRFESIFAGESHPLPFVFNRTEIDHARSAPSPAQLLCLTFACKEALLKAAGQAYDYTQCVILPTLQERSLGERTEQEIVLSPALKAAFGAKRASFRWCHLAEDREEMVTAVYLFGEERLK